MCVVHLWSMLLQLYNQSRDYPEILNFKSICDILIISTCLLKVWYKQVRS